MVIHRQCVQSLMDAGEWSAQLLFFDETWLVIFCGQAFVRNRMLF
ncbi:hypothetical protein SynWH8103_02771 [Synechococcus sp. WH 8103]|nr:hypothetical protein SynBOUM118_02678 [Synechococcus sp. BOUM118]QNJ18217.1 hypothetical protein SynA1840_02712 [Synechococcus sp. A18-40]CRY93450.1 hypothetical protein SynWH8103_02771 [Synechococcus sp. WH 8103]